MIDRHGYWLRSRTITRRLRYFMYLLEVTKDRSLNDASSSMPDGSRIWYETEGSPTV